MVGALNDIDAGQAEAAFSILAQAPELNPCEAVSIGLIHGFGELLTGNVKQQKDVVTLSDCIERQENDAARKQQRDVARCFAKFFLRATSHQARFQAVEKEDPDLAFDPWVCCTSRCCNRHQRFP